MKQLFIAVVALSISLSCHAQWENDVEKFRKKAVKDYPDLSLRHIQFMIDTFTIETKMQWRLDNEPGMQAALLDAGTEWDALLNKTYKTLQTELSAPAKAKLTAAEKAWVAYSENEIKFYDEKNKDEYAGEIARLERIMFAVKLTKKRTIELHEHLEGESF